MKSLLIFIVILFIGFAVTTNDWKTFSTNNCPNELAGATSVPLNKYAYIFGGLNEQYPPGGPENDTFFNTLYEYNSNNHKCTLITTTGAIPSPRAFHAVGLYEAAHGDDIMFVYGGSNYKNGGLVNNTVLGDFYMLNLKTNVWTQLSHPAGVPKNLTGAAGFVADEEFCVFAGLQQNFRFPVNELHCYDFSSSLVSGTWRTINVTAHGPAPAPRFVHAIEYNHFLDRFVIYGGQSEAFGATRIAFDDVWLYDHLTETFQLLTNEVTVNGSEASRYAGVVSYKKYLIIQGGKIGRKADFTATVTNHTVVYNLIANVTCYWEEGLWAKRTVAEVFNDRMHVLFGFGEVSNTTTGYPIFYTYNDDAWELKLKHRTCP